ncbi:hypothetical protein ENKNEFLB_01946 [Nocardioides aquaticus]|uniref:Terminase small subunit n=1 Tax=Nocardioides aquaticus TaxID=160826 RepID=A0ABX8ELR3_9ACTN|nr:P27 family phage terminase small subunit [Nocardioides aquaticus]QVT79563.1 hypothetical protein ENKNEFLB_01946 [Nocardioides aquaticus]
MSATEVPEAPETPDFGPRGAAFWGETTTLYELSETETELLRECCRLLDECESLCQALAEQGVTVPGSQGQTRVHPAIGELRQHRLALGRLLGQLSLPDVSEDALKTPAQVRASKAAQSRWRSHNERRAANG